MGGQTEPKRANPSGRILEMNVVKDNVDIGVLVRDIDACLKFYCEALGFPKVEQRRIGDRSQHRVQIGKTLLKLLESPGNPPPLGPHGRFAQAGFSYITIQVDDAAATAKELETRGVVFTDPPHPNSVGDTVASFEDPEGNTIEIVSNKQE
jgi:catechol 2,3-dioxygenase-like lactoylglutathione lyase family enzyme